jgi:galactose mutarotase-like enzyme
MDCLAGLGFCPKKSALCVDDVFGLPDPAQTKRGVRMIRTWQLTREDTAFGITPRKGGMVAFLRFQGQDILHTDNASLQGESMTVHGGIPILFPVCGALKEDAWYDGGKRLPMPKHGLARLHPWAETACRQTANEVETTWKLASDPLTAPDMHHSFPFSFELSFTYLLKPDAFRIITRVNNLSGRSMPFSLGMHPYFAVSRLTQVRLNMTADMYEIYEDSSFLPVSRGLPVADLTRSLFVHGLEARQVMVHDSGRPMPILLRYSEHFKHLVIWSDQPCYLCLEPWTARPDALNTGEDVISLAPGASWEAWMEIGKPAIR